MLGFGKKNAGKPAGPASGMGVPTQKVAEWAVLVKNQMEIKMTRQAKRP